ncbi:MAG: ABC transporter permease [Pyrinomonadaceae bacterium]|nr:ABC transporter permease [Pyrinomonadaceae bacterium]
MPNKTDKISVINLQPLAAEEQIHTSTIPAKKKARRFMVYAQAFAFLLGIGLLLFIVNKVGVQPIFDALKQIGFGFFALLAIIAVRHALRTLAMSTAVPPEHRGFHFFQAFFARVGGEAITFLTFTGPLLGEATKAALLRKSVPLGVGVRALVVDNLLYNLSVALFILSGACVMLLSYDLPDVALYVLLGIATSALLTLLAVGWAASRRMMPLTSLVDGLVKLGLKRKLLLARREGVHLLEANVYDFYRHRRGAFFAMIGLDFLSHVTSVIEVYVTLRMLGFDPGAGVPYIIESLTKVINFVFGFVPATIGVYEGGTGLILHTLGLGTTAGVTLALVRKAGTIFWTGIGLSTLVWRTVPGGVRRVVNRHPRLKEAMDNLVLSNIAHRPARTFVSVLGVAVGVLLIVFTVGLAHGVLRERGRREAGVGAEIMLRASGTLGMSGAQPFSLDVSIADDIRQLPGVRAAVAIGQNTVGTDTGFGVRIIDGVPFDEYIKLANLKVVEGRLPAGNDETIVDSIWIEQREAKVGDTVQLYERAFRVVGVYEPPGGGRIKIPLAVMQEQVGVENRATTILVACDDPAQQEDVAARIQEKFPELQLIFMRDLPELYASGVPALNVFIGVVVAVAAAISLLVILLAMYTTVTERTRQIGILKSLGMSSTAIAWIIEQEALLVSVLGVILGVVLTFIARFAVMRATNLTVEIEPRWILISLLIGIVGGTIGALYPALRAARQDAVAALSYE